jgi:2-keto-4-pentenoate hydratase/2-oxohepta-3-ene-1,7-dioic acid hydratase in catechol pathway
LKLQQLWRAYGEAERWPCLFVWSTYLVTLDEIGDVANLDVLLTLNGEEMQSANHSISSSNAEHGVHIPRPKAA